MAIPFLNNITLNNNEIQNVRLHNTGTSNAAAGQIFFNTGVDLAQYYANAIDQWVSLKEYSFPIGTYVTGTVTGTTPKPIITFDLNAVDGVAGSGERYLTKSNTWAEVSGISGTTYDLDSIQVGSDVAITLVGSDATVDTVTLVAGTNITLTDDGSANITIDTTGNQAITLSGDVTGSGTTSIATTISAGAVDFAMLNPTGVITEAEGIENNDNDITIPTSAAVKAYADSLIVGGLIYQGGYNASTNTPDLTTSPNSILKGWTYTVTVEGTFFGEQLRVGDVLIAEENDPSALTDWTTVQNNIDLASLTQIGIGNVNAGTGISVAYSNGTATVTNTLTNSDNTYAVTITDTATITHGLGTKDVIIQLYDVTTNETVYADVDRASTTTATITFATTPTNSVRVLVQKIG